MVTVLQLKDVVKYLIDKGCDQSSKDIHIRGKTPIRLAIL